MPQVDTRIDVNIATALQSLDDALRLDRFVNAVAVEATEHVRTEWPVLTGNSALGLGHRVERASDGWRIKFTNTWDYAVWVYRRWYRFDARLLRFLPRVIERIYERTNR